MGDKLTEQDRGFVKDLVRTGNATQAVKNNYDIEDDNYAGVKANRLLRKDKIQNAIQDAIPDTLLSSKHLQFLNSEKEEIGIKALDLGYKLKGAYAPEKSLNVNIDIDTASPEARALAEEYESKLKERM